MQLTMEQKIGDDIREWMREILKKTGLTPTELARKSGVAHSTLTRFLSGESKNVLSSRTIAKIAHVARVQPVRSAISPPQEIETEAIPFGGRLKERFPDHIQKAVAAIASRSPSLEVWFNCTHLMEGVGIIPGDIVFVDTKAYPSLGGIGKIACVEDRRDAKTRTIFRIYSPPFLVTATIPRLSLRPILHDRHAIVVKGTVTEVLRWSEFPGPAEVDDFPE